MKKLNKKGMTMVEIIVSVALISIVLIFLMSLFVSVRGTYNQSKIQSDYDILVSNIIKAIGDDIENYGLEKVEYVYSGRYDQIVLTYKTFRSSRLSENIKKVLKLWLENNVFYISYAYEPCTGGNDSICTKYITGQERSVGVVRSIPDDAITDRNHYIYLKRSNNAVEIKVPLTNGKGNIYDINVYGILQ